MTLTRSLFRYYGGKWRLAPWIVQHFSEHKVYVEPFCGAGSVFFRKKRAYGEVLNDLSGEIVNFFRVMQNDVTREELKTKICFTPYSRMEYDLSHEIVDDPVERARRLLVRSLMGYNGDSCNTENYHSGFRNDCGRGYTIPAHDWANYPNSIQFFADRLRGVLIENLDAFTLMDKYSKYKDILWYLDPPYPHSTRTRANQHRYFVEFNDDDHRRLVERILCLPGNVILSGYRTELYTPLESAGWRRIEKTYRNNTFQSGERTECLWIKPVKKQGINRVTEHQRQMTFNFQEAL